MKPITLFSLIALIIIASLAAPVQPVSAATQLRITSVSALSAQNLWTVRLSNGVTLRVEKRAFSTGGSAPAPGTVTDFHDQGWLPILGYYGYATFAQGGVTFYGYR